MDPESVMAREERSEAMKPDIVKLREYAAAIEAVPIPAVEDKNVNWALQLLIKRVEQACELAETWCDQQEAR